jgi:hypothetical protein
MRPWSQGEIILFCYASSMLCILATVAFWIAGRMF